jgi:hypothetical protein
MRVTETDIGDRQVQRGEDQPFTDAACAEGMAMRHLVLKRGMQRDGQGRNGDGQKDRKPRQDKQRRAPYGITQDDQGECRPLDAHLPSEMTKPAPSCAASDDKRA